jgi:hypothetical protein
MYVYLRRNDDNLTGVIFRNDNNSSGNIKGYLPDVDKDLTTDQNRATYDLKACASPAVLQVIIDTGKERVK